MDQNKEYLTQEKYDQLQAELDNLRRVRRKEVAENLEYAKSLGDLSENAEYHEARDEQAKIEERIAQLEAVFKVAEIVKPHHSTQVEIGSTVTVKKEGDASTQEFTLVSSEESDIASGKISYRSPLGEALLGKKKGETASFTTPNGDKEYTVVDIA